jgi:hypothetical protein
MNARLKTMLVAVFLILPFSSASADRPGVPEDYPSHAVVKNCDNGTVSAIGPEDRRVLGDLLKDYTELRLGIADVLRRVSEDYQLNDEQRKRMLDYVAMFESLADTMPPAYPDSSEFQNFDFKMGMSFMSLLYYINEDEVTAKQFYSDRDDPKSPVGEYITTVDASRSAYENALESVRKTACSGTLG